MISALNMDICSQVLMYAFWNMLQKPGAYFIKAAKAGVTDGLQGSLDALAWGKIPSFGTGGQFELIYSAKVFLTSG